MVLCLSTQFKTHYINFKIGMLLLNCDHLFPCWSLYKNYRPTAYWNINDLWRIEQQDAIFWLKSINLKVSKVNFRWVYVPWKSCTYLGLYNELNGTVYLAFIKVEKLPYTYTSIQYKGVYKAIKPTTGISNFVERMYLVYNLVFCTRTRFHHQRYKKFVFIRILAMLTVE